MNFIMPFHEIIQLLFSSFFQKKIPKKSFKENTTKGCPNLTPTK